MVRSTLSVAPKRRARDWEALRHGVLERLTKWVVSRSSVPSHETVEFGAPGFDRRTATLTVVQVSKTAPSGSAVRRFWRIQSKQSSPSTSFSLW